ncbi:MAG: hypothetical protein ACI9SB_001440 [Candidatus Azotimanducaceae bacterium]|jgi:hypothetical protein
MRAYQEYVSIERLDKPSYALGYSNSDYTSSNMFPASDLSLMVRFRLQ